MNKLNKGFRLGQHRLEGVIGLVLMAAWVIGSVVTVGMQGGAAA